MGDRRAVGLDKLAPDLLSIGQFSRRCRLPVSTLRYYHEIGLLVPEVVDPGSGYRYYSPGQVQTSVLIAEMRWLGIGPEVIKNVLAGGVGAGSALRTERERMRHELTRREAALDFIEKTLSSPWVVELSAFELTTLPPRRAVTVSGDIEAMNAIAGVRRLVAAAGREVRRRGLTVTGPAGALFSLDLEASPIAVTAFTPVAPAEDLANLPEGPVATVVYRGDLRGLAAAYQGLLDWIEERGLVAVDPFVEEYLARDKGLVVRLSVGVAA